MPSELHGAHGEREIKKFRVTKRELLNNLSNIYKCKVSSGGTFSLGNFLFDERELSGLIGTQRENIYIFSSDKREHLHFFFGQKQGHLRGTYMYTSV